MIGSVHLSPKSQCLANSPRRGIAYRALVGSAWWVLLIALTLSCVLGGRVGDAVGASFDTRLLAGTPWDINDFGQIVRQNDVVVPGVVVQSLGINNAGHIVGSMGNQAFLKTGGLPAPIGVAGAITSVANRINNFGEVVGFFQVSQVPQRFKGFLRQTNGSIVVIEFPGADSTFPRGINDAGWIVGSYSIQGQFHAFVKDASGYRTLATPAPGCDARDIDNAGRVIGACEGSSGPLGSTPGFSYLKHGLGDTARVDILLLGSDFTFALGMDNRGHIVGVLSSEPGGSDPGFLASPAHRRNAPPDFDGDLTVDIAVYRGGSWFAIRSSDGGVTATDWGGLPQDTPVPADYDGDRKTDIAVYRDGTWFIRRSSDGGVTATDWGGAPQDIPVPADYDGDRKTDIAVYRDGTWFIRRSSDGGVTATDWGGLPQDIPVPADYDGDGKTDIAVYRGGTWFIRRSSDGGVTATDWGGLPQDIPVPADYDGDRKTDIAVYRDGTWFIRRSSDGGVTATAWGGLPQDIPVPADYDGDGKTDFAVYRDGAWLIIRSSDGGVIVREWGGLPQDVPLN